MDHAPQSEEELFLSAQELSPERRARFLDAACAGDAELRRRVERLLHAHDTAGSFLGGGAGASARIGPGPLTASSPEEQSGEWIDRYRLLERIGEGGCGVVWMAEQETPIRRRVALKVIKLGMDTKEVIARFESERQALALMNHPNIATVLDAGTTAAGRPYFVMELVRGTKITDYCDEHRLGTGARVKLFTQVCHAIQHAHQKGIIHRDLKPSNILVTQQDGEPLPKVIDFGIAKATQGRLTDRTIFTAFAQFIGTPAYMSPEQAELTSQDVDTRSDIYSLGVLLYELLTGATPLDAKTLAQAAHDEVRRMIREVDPPRPSNRLRTLEPETLTTAARRRSTEAIKLVRLVHGDLDWIVMRCLEKSRARRYATASELARDLELHLAHEPISARPPSAVYRIAQFCRRHRVFVVSAATIALAVVCGGSAAGWMYVRERSARERAILAEREQADLRAEAEAAQKRSEAAAAKSDQVARFLADTFRGAGPSVARGRDTAILREILDATSERLDRELTEQPDVEATLRHVIGSVYLEVVDLEKAERMLRRSLELRRRIFGEEHLDVAASLMDLAHVCWNRGAFDEAEAMVSEAVEIRQHLLGSEHPDVAAAYTALAYRLDQRGDFERAGQLIDKALEIQRKVLPASDPAIVRSLLIQSLICDSRGEYRRAEGILREILATTRSRWGGDHPDTVEALGRLGKLLVGGMDFPAAEPVLRETLDTARRIHGQDHPLIAGTLVNLALLHARLGQMVDAESTVREGIEMDRRMFGPTSPHIANFLCVQAGILRQAGRLQEAEQVGRESLGIARTTRRDVDPELIPILEELSEILAECGELAEAEALEREALAGLDRQQGSPREYNTPGLLRLAGILRARGDTTGASACIQQLLRTLEQPTDPDVNLAMLEYAVEGLIRAGSHPAETEILARRMAAIVESRVPRDGARIHGALRMLGTSLAKQRKLGDAEETLRRAFAIAESESAALPMARETALNLIAVLCSSHKPAEARAVLDRAAVWKSGAFDPQGRDVWRLRGAIAHEDYLAGNYSEAGTLGEQVLAVLHGAGGSPDPMILLALETLGNVAEVQQRPEEAVARRREALRYANEMYGPATMEARQASLVLARVLVDTGDPAEAAQVLETVRSGEDFDNWRGMFRACVDAETARAMLALGRLSDAERHLKDAFAAAAIDAESAGRWEVCRWKVLSGAVLKQQERYGEAEVAFVDGCRGLLSILAAFPMGERRHVRQLLDMLIQFLREQGKPAEAEGWDREFRALADVPFGGEQACR